MEEQVAYGVSSHQRVISPWPSDFKFNAGPKVARREVLLRERTGLMDGAAPHYDPVEEWRGAQIEILPQELLVHLERRFGVAPDGELQSGIQNDARASQPEDRRGAHAENRVVGIAMNDSQLVGNRDGAFVVPHAEEAGDRHEVPGMIAEGGSKIGLLRRTRRRRSAEKFVVHLVERCIFKD